MKTILVTIFFVLLSDTSSAFTGDGMPFKYISSCEIDLNGDGASDKALLIEGLKGRELLALLSKSSGYEAIVVSNGKVNMYLFCKQGPEVKERESGGGRGRTVKTPGAYLELVKPESSSVAYVFKKGVFEEIWTSD